MANYSGISGPPPKRDDDKLGHPHGSKDSKIPIDKIDQVREIRPMKENPAWTEVAKYAYRAFLDSPLNQFYTETDVAYGWMTANAIHLAATKNTAMHIQAAESMMRSAMFNEADRRRVRIEVTRKEPESNPAAAKNKDQLAERRAARDAM